MGIDFLAPRKGEKARAKGPAAKLKKTLEELATIEAEKLKLLKPGSLKTIWGKLDNTMDSEYWACLVFQTREQAEAFGRFFGKPGDKYLDGRMEAKALGIKMP